MYRAVEARGGDGAAFLGDLYLGLAAHWRGDWETAERELRLADQLEARPRRPGRPRGGAALAAEVAGRYRDLALQGRAEPGAWREDRDMGSAWYPAAVQVFK